MVAKSSGNAQRAEELLRESVARFRAIGDRPGLGSALRYLGYLVGSTGRFREGEARLREQAIALYQGDYLDQCYYEWAETERQRRRQVYLQTLRALADYHAKGGRPERAIAHLVTAIEQESVDESLHRKLLALHARVGDWPALVHHYESLQALLERDLGTKPDVKTQDLYRRLLARRDGEPKPADIPL